MQRQRECSRLAAAATTTAAGTAAPTLQAVKRWAHLHSLEGCAGSQMDRGCHIGTQNVRNCCLLSVPSSAAGPGAGAGAPPPACPAAPVTAARQMRDTHTSLWCDLILGETGALRRGLAKPLSCPLGDPAAAVACRRSCSGWGGPPPPPRCAAGLPLLFQCRRRQRAPARRAAEGQPDRRGRENKFVHLRRSDCANSCRYAGLRAGQR